MSNIMIAASFAVACVLLSHTTGCAASPGETLWRQSIPGELAAGASSGVFQKRYLAAVTSAFEPDPSASSQEFNLTVLDWSGGHVMLRMNVVVDETSKKIDKVNDLHVFPTGIACVAFHSGTVACGDTVTGRKLFDVKPDAAKPESCTGPHVKMFNNQSFIVDCETHFFVLLMNGDVKFSVGGDYPWGQLVTSVGSTAYVVTDGPDGLVAYDLETGQKKWTQPELPSDQSATIACASDTVVVVQDREFRYRGYRASDGAKMWMTYHVAYGETSCTNTQFWYYGGTFNSNNVHVLNITTGTELFSLDASMKNMALAVEEGIALHIVCSTSAKVHVPPAVQAFDLNTGHLMWKTAVPLTTCMAARYQFDAQAVTAGMPVTVLLGNILAVPNRIGINLFSIKTGDRITADGLGALQFSILEGIDTGFAVKDKLFALQASGDGDNVTAAAYSLL